MPYKILIADPSASVRKILQMALPEPDFRLYQASDGEELLKSLTEIDPDAAIISLSLPGLKGRDAGRMLRDLPGQRDIPLVGLYGMFEAPRSEAWPPAGLDAVFEKPFDSTELAERLRRLIADKSGPASIPEMSELDVRRRQSEEAALPAGDGLDSGKSDDQELRRLVRAEILEVERELEKRIKARLLDELRNAPPEGMKR